MPKRIRDSRVRTRHLLLLVPGAVAVSVVVTWIEGTAGPLSAFQLAADVRRVFDPAGAPAGPPEFPLVRDYVSWVLLAVIVGTGALVHRQWTLMAECLPKLSGVLRPRREAEAAERPFADVLAVTDRVFAGVRASLPFVALIAAALTALLLRSERENGVFEVLAPAGLSPDAHAAWLRAAYDSWWAADGHRLGHLLYATVATAGLFAILLQNIVGALAVVVVVRLGKKFDFAADWSNRDRWYGWEPVAKAFQTVLWSLTLHGLAISLLLVTLGIENFRWVLGILALYVIALPAYTVVPWLVFRRIDRDARRLRDAEIDAECVRRARVDPIGADAWAATQRADMEKVRLNPIRVRRRAIPAFVFAVLLPNALAAAQLIFQVKFGAR